MQTNFEDIRDYLLKNGLYNTINILDKEMSERNKKSSSSQQQIQEPSNPVLNLSFGENDSSQQKEGSFKIENQQVSTKNHFDMHFDKSVSQSKSISANSQNKPGDNWVKSEVFGTNQKIESSKSNPFNVLNDAGNNTDQKKSAVANDEERFSFGGENDNEFDSFSKSHNNKFSNNENAELEDPNVFGNSFDINLDGKGSKKVVVSTALRNTKTGNRFSNDDDVIRQKSGLTEHLTSDNSPQAKTEIMKSEVKSIDNDLQVDVRFQANKRNSQGFGNVFSNNRGLAKKLFPGMESDDIFRPLNQRSPIGRYSNPEKSEKDKQPKALKPEYADNCRLNSY